MLYAQPFDVEQRALSSRQRPLDPHAADPIGTHALLRTAKRGRYRVIALLMILAAGLLVGRFARRITPPLEMLLLLIVAAIVLVQLVAWKAGMDLHVRHR